MKQSRLFELEYKELMEMFADESWEVKSPGYLIDQVTGKEREVDVLITRKVGEVERKIGIECRDRKRPQGIDWIEEFITKKNDIGLDIMILASSSGFSETAKIKAKHHGIILEAAERINSKLVKDCSEIAYFNNYYLYTYVERLVFVTEKNKIITVRELLDSNHIGVQQMILNEINTVLYWEVCTEIDKILKDSSFVAKEFFIEKNQSHINLLYETKIKDEVMSIFSELGIKYLYMTVDVKPVTYSIPLESSMASFDFKKGNKRYHGKFSNKSDRIEVVYNDEDTRIMVEVDFEHRHHLRLVKGEVFLNTIIPSDKVFNSTNIEKQMMNFIGSFDLKNVL